MDSGLALRAPRRDELQRSRGAIRVRVMRHSWPSESRRARGTPDAGRTRGPCVQRRCASCARKQRQGSRNSRHSPHNGFTAYTWSPRCAGLSGHRRLAFATRDLIPASGNRDRTISPSASAHSSRAPQRPSHPATRQVTIGLNAPLAGRDRRNIRLICPYEKANYFRSTP